MKPLWAGTLSFLVAAVGVAGPRPVDACAAPPGFANTPHPPLVRLEELVSRQEEIVIHRPLDVVLRVVEKPLRDTIRPSLSLPGVTGDRMLTEGEFGAPGSRRLACLSDRSTVVEQVLERERNADAFRFRYVVWNFTSPKARPVAFAIGKFRYTAVGNNSTKVRWLYSFQLNRDVFPGRLGGLGRWLFQVTFLDRDYADMMRQVLEGYKNAAEKVQ